MKKKGTGLERLRKALGITPEYGKFSIGDPENVTREKEDGSVELDDEDGGKLTVSIGEPKLLARLSVPGPDLSRIKEPTREKEMPPVRFRRRPDGELEKDVESEHLSPKSTGKSADKVARKEALKRLLKGPMNSAATKYDDEEDDDDLTVER